MRYKLWKEAMGFFLVMVALIGFASVTQAGSLEPSAAPGPTMKTLDEIPPTWSKILPASERFKLVMGGAAVLDKETGLVWEKSPINTTSSPVNSWYGAIYACHSEKTVGGRKGWRLPTVEELESLMDPTQYNPMLPSGHPFSNVQQVYWSAMTSIYDTTYAYAVGFVDGRVAYSVKTSGYYVWCVRGGQGYNGNGY